MVKYFFFLTFVLSSYLWASSGLYNHSYWHKLLEYKDSNNLITSSEFFLSNKVNPSPKEELDATINLLHSKDGQTIACNFPARYLWIQKQIKVPEYNLKKCKDLDNFITNFKKDSLSIVFTSEYINAPSSAFGHIMLLFNDNNSPYEIADTIHFAAETKDEGFFKYAYKGFTGKYEAYVLREPFFKKIYEYNTLEQRYMYIYQLKFSKEQIYNIIYHLYELRKATFKYYFLSENCSSKIIDILELAFDRSNDSSYIYTLPIDTLKKYENYIVKENKFLPLEVTINYLTSKMNKKELNDFNFIIKTNAIPTNNLSDLTKEALVNYYILLFRKFGKSYKNYDDIMRLKYSHVNIEDTTPVPLKKTQPSEFSLGYYRDDIDEGLQLKYRPLLTNISDIQNNSLQESEVSLFTSTIFIKKDKIKLTDLNIIQMKSYPKHLVFSKPISWSLYSGLNKKNERNKLAFDNNIALGITKSLLFDNFVSFTLGLGIDTDLIYADFYANPSINIMTHLTKKTKFGFTSEYKEYITKNYYENSIYVNQKISNKYNFLLSYKKVNNQANEKIEFALKYNF